MNKVVTNRCFNTKAFFSALIIITMCGFSAANAANITTLREHKVWDNKPAEKWQHAYPLGNGSLGAMTYGGFPHEQILLNDETIWTGRLSPQNKTDLKFHIDAAREDLFNGKVDEAHEHVNDLLAGRHSPRSFVPIGYMHINYDSTFYGTELKEYHRQLVMNDGIASTEFETANGNKIKQETFSSHPDNVIIIRLESKKKGGLTFDLNLDRYAHFKAESLDNNTLMMSGQAQAYKEQITDMGNFEGTCWNAVARVINNGGSATANGSVISVKGANSVTVVVSSSTDYNYRQPFLTLRHDRKEACLETISKVENVAYDVLKDRHLQDFQGFLPRATVDFGDTPAKTLAKTTAERLDAMRKGVMDPDLIEDYFQMGRYLLISASRPGTLPPNLTGIWNARYNPKCHSNWTFDIAIEEAYWHCESTNLSELHEPYITLMDDIRLNQGKQLAEYLGCRGFTVGVNTHGWKEAAFSGNAEWGMWAMGGVWSAQHVMDHYRFTLDKDYLVNTGLPIMKDNVLFILDWLVENPHTGKLVSGPSTSPENNYYIGESRKKYTVSMGTTSDQMAIYGSLTDYIDAAEDLDLKDELYEQVVAAREQLARPQIGSDGRIMEWAEEYKEWQVGHRHQSHMWGVFPGREITPEGTPELTEAAIKSMTVRIQKQPSWVEGWSRAHAFNIWSRLHQGEDAYKALTWLMDKKTLPNLMHQEPPIYFDGSGASTAGIVETLVQSHTDLIQLLPALPAAWPEGSLRGICARGGFVIDMTWKDGKVVSAEILSKVGGDCKVQVNGEIVELNTEAGKRYTVR